MIVELIILVIMGYVIIRIRNNINKNKWQGKQDTTPAESKL